MSSEITSFSASFASCFTESMAHRTLSVLNRIRMTLCNFLCKTSEKIKSKRHWISNQVLHYIDVLSLLFSIFICHFQINRDQRKKEKEYKRKCDADNSHLSPRKENEHLFFYMTYLRIGSATHILVFRFLNVAPILLLLFLFFCCCCWWCVCYWNCVMHEVLVYCCFGTAYNT